MSLRFNCNTCGNAVVTQFQKVGDQVACGTCGALNFVPGNAVSDPGAQPAPQALQSEDFSTILTDTFRLPFTSLKKLFLISLVSAVPMQLFEAVMTRRTLSQGPMTDPIQVFSRMLPAFLGIFALAMVLHTFTGSAMCVAVTDYFLKRPVSVARAFGDAILRVPAVFGSTLLVGLCVVLLMVTLIGIPVAVFLSIAWALYLPSAVLMRTGPARSLSASAALVKGSWWRVFWILIIVGVGSCFIALMLSLLTMFMPGPVKSLISLFGSMLIVTFGDLGSLLVFSHLRVRKQGFTLEQLAAERDALSAS